MAGTPSSNQRGMSKRTYGHALCAARRCSVVMRIRRYAEMGSGEKKKISHRARSLKKLLDYLQENEEAVKAAIATCEAAATTTSDEKK